MGCQYCRIKDITTYANKKTRIPTKYCPVCGKERKYNDLDSRKTFTKDYISKSEMICKISDEMFNNFPDALPRVCKAMKIPDEYQDKLKDIVQEELNTVRDMLDCEDEFTVFVPNNRWSSYSKFIKQKKKTAEQESIINKIKTELEKLKS